MPNEISLSLPSHQGILGILSTDTLLLFSHCCISLHKRYSLYLVGFMFSTTVVMEYYSIATACIKLISEVFPLYLSFFKGFGLTNSGLVLHNKASVDNAYWLKCSGQGVIQNKTVMYKTRRTNNTL